MKKNDYIYRCRKYIWQNSTPVHDQKKKKTSQKLGIAGNILNLKGINKPPTAITYVIMGDWMLSP